ncbi:MAG: P44/Msp2 family outer membrane protein [Pseudomonadota bacterium]
MSAKSVRAKLTIMSVVGGLIASTPPALAQGVETQEEPRDWSIYARFGVGAAFANRLDQDLAYDPRVAFIVTPPNRRVTDFDAAASPTFALGFSYPSGARTELEYRFLRPSFERVTEFGGFDPTVGPLDPTDIEPAEDFTAHFLMSNVYYEVARAGPASLFVGAGVGGGFFSNGLGARDAAFAYQGRGGVSFELSESAAISLEYVYLRTRDLVLGPDELGVDDGFSQAAGDQFVMSGVDLSLAVRF